MLQHVECCNSSEPSWLRFVPYTEYVKIKNLTCFWSSPLCVTCSCRKGPIENLTNGLVVWSDAFLKLFFFWVSKYPVRRYDKHAEAPFPDSADLLAAYWCTFIDGQSSFENENVWLVWTSFGAVSSVLSHRLLQASVPTPTTTWFSWTVWEHYCTTTKDVYIS